MCVCGEEVLFASLIAQRFDMVLKNALGTAEEQNRPSTGLFCG